MAVELTTKTEEAIEETLAVFDALNERRGFKKGSGACLSPEAIASLTAAVMSRRGRDAQIFE